MTNWELIASTPYFDTHRLKVFGGWLVRDYRMGGDFRVIFIEDKNHEWELTND